MIAEVDARFEELPEGKDPLTYVIDKNLTRRHLTAGQRAFIGERLATNPHGGSRRDDDPFEDQVANLRLDEAARLVGVSERSISTARAMIDAQAWNLIDKVEAGELTLNAAATKFNVPKSVMKTDKVGRKSNEEKYHDAVRQLFAIAAKDNAMADFRKALTRFYENNRNWIEGLKLLETYLTRRITQLQNAKETVEKFYTSGPRGVGVKTLQTE